jgi:hypothetical protein
MTLYKQRLKQISIFFVKSSYALVPREEIGFPNEPLVSGIEISSPRGLKKTLKISPWEGKRFYT